MRARSSHSTRLEWIELTRQKSVACYCNSFFPFLRPGAGAKVLLKTIGQNSREHERVLSCRARVMRIKIDPLYATALRLLRSSDLNPAAADARPRDIFHRRARRRESRTTKHPAREIARDLAPNRVGSFSLFLRARESEIHPTEPIPLTSATRVSASRAAAHTATDNTANRVLADAVERESGARISPPRLWLALL